MINCIKKKICTLLFLGKSLYWMTVLWEKKFRNESKTHLMVVTECEWYKYFISPWLPYIYQKNFNGGLLNQSQLLKVLIMYKNMKYFLHPHLKNIVFNVLKRGLLGRALSLLNLRFEYWVLTQQSSAWKHVWFHFHHSVLTCSRLTMHTKWCE